MSWLFPGQEIHIDATCLDCLEPIFVRMRDGEVLEADPTTIVGHQNISSSQEGVTWPDR
ncbi:MAG: hypothetical protein IH960_00210 [Chloroflexi bacterium]|nr:hypothetical protein [Chloroflexota bacterium]MCH7982837.1 hypothetical protein [Chloroflexota bacterium]MCH8115432.1 hypothetical protein [Chloroflexota bacterium]MCH8228987.1 hypothetical protein [Chloroflexota bacterium]MCI0774300.1 hypothetical protein [Chloroflexota bacterium]